MTASSTCAVQMFDVAFSRRMCCSRVCSARRSARRPSLSTETPTRRPGSERRLSSRTAMNPAWGPPKPSGTPKRCAEPTTTSAPHSPGGASSVSASRSAVTHTVVPAPRRRSASAAWSRTAPDDPGYASRTPKHSWAPRSVSGSPTTSFTPSGSARVCNTSMTCGWQSASTKNVSPGTLDRRRARVIASAAAVASSSSDALAMSIPVSSATTVWKFNNASRRPWEISGWYGV